MMMPFGNVGSDGKVQASLDFYMDANATNGTGVLELTVLSGRRVYCPVDFIRPGRIDTVRGELTQLMADVEDFYGDPNIYDETAMLEPGCLLDSFVPPE